MLKMFLVWVCLVCSAVCAFSQPSEYFTCLDDSNFCMESPFDTLHVQPQLACGQTFLRFSGRLASPKLRNAGPVTISVKSMGGRTPFFVEIRARVGPGELALECTTLLAGSLVLLAQGFPRQCGGVWASVGPLDLTQQIGIPLGGTYHVQVIGFGRGGNGDLSPGLACIRVETNFIEQPVALRTWASVKRIYR